MNFFGMEENNLGLPDDLVEEVATADLIVSMKGEYLVIGDRAAFEADFSAEIANAVALVLQGQPSTKAKEAKK